MKQYQKEILEAYLAADEQAAKRFRQAFIKALKKTALKIKMLQMSEIMERLPQAQTISLETVYGEQLELPQQRGAVYQRQYQQEITEYIQEPMNELEEEQKSIFVEAMKVYFIIGALSSLYELHKQKVPVILPVKTTPPNISVGTVTISFSEVQVAPWYKYIRRDMEELKVKTVADVQRAIAQGKPYNEIARSMAKSMESGTGATTSKKAYNKAMTIVRTEGGGIRNEAAYNAMLEAKKAGADITKQWEAVLDGRTRDSHRMLDGEIRELEEPFSNGLLYPCQLGGAAAEVINCRCVAMSRARWALDEAELQTQKERAEYFGLDKTKNFEEFKRKYLDIQE